MLETGEQESQEENTMTSLNHEKLAVGIFQQSRGEGFRCSSLWRGAGADCSSSHVDGPETTLRE